MSPLKGFFYGSIARKFWMALSGLFLVVFLVVHLSINMLLLSSDPSWFNEASHFMATNIIIQVAQYILAAGFLLHILMGIKLTLQNRAARPVNYAYNKPGENSSWASRNMIVTGLMVLLFLIIHLRNFFYVMKFGDMGDLDDYSLVTDLFGIWYYTLIYVVAFVLLGIHLNHGFQSAFQTIGWRNNKWKGILSLLGTIYSVVIAVGFSAIAIYHFIN